MAQRRRSVLAGACGVVVVVAVAAFVGLGSGGAVAGERHSDSRSPWRPTLARAVKATKTDWSRLSWKQQVARAKWVKSGLSKAHYQYPMIGGGGLWMLVDPLGFGSYRVPAASYNPDIFYDYWWDEDPSRANPFVFAGGYVEQDGGFDPGTISQFQQELDIATATAHSDLSLTHGSQTQPTNSKRVSYVTPEGVLVIRVSDDRAARLAVRITNGQPFDPANWHPKTPDGAPEPFELAYDADGTVLTAVSSGGFAKHHGLSVTATGSGVAVDPDAGTVSADISPGHPVTFYVAASSELEGPPPGPVAAAKVKRAVRAGYGKAQQATRAFWDRSWSKSELSVPDDELQKNYIRRQYVSAMVMSGKIPPGDIGPRKENYHGAVGTEYDQIYPFLALLAANQPELTAASADWIEDTLPAAEALAQHYTYDGKPSTGAKYAWIAGWDGTEVESRGPNPYPPGGWEAYPGANMAMEDIMQAQYTNDPARLERAKHVLEKVTQYQLDNSAREPAHGNMWLNQRFEWFPCFCLERQLRVKGAVQEQTALTYSLRKAKELNVGPPAWRQYADEVYMPIAFDQLQQRDAIVGYAGDTPGIDTMYALHMPTHWFNTVSPKDPLAWPTYMNVVGSNWSWYTFMRGQWAINAADMGLGDVARDFLQQLLESGDGGVLFDDMYFTEVTGAPWTTPEIGADGSFMLGLQHILVDAQSMDTIKIFPAVPSDWETGRPSFSRMLGNGGIEVSGEYTPQATSVTLRNNGPRPATRTVLVRIPTGAREVDASNGLQVEKIVDGQFAQLKVTVNPRKTISFKIAASRQSHWRTLDDHDPSVTYTGDWSTIQAGCQQACQQFSDTQGRNNWHYQDGEQPDPLCHQACQQFADTQGANNWRYQDGPLAGCDQACQQFSDTQGKDNWHYQTQSPPGPPPCHMACQGFSDTQGANGWSYQKSVSGGGWANINTYNASGFGEPPDCCAWFDFNGPTDLSGIVGPRFMLPGVGHDTARAWTAPKDGVIDISAKAVAIGNEPPMMTITKNGEAVWGPQKASRTAPVETSVADLAVAAGDVIRFQLTNSQISIVLGSFIQWDPDVVYQGDPPPPPSDPPPQEWLQLVGYSSDDWAADGPSWHDEGTGNVSKRRMLPAPRRNVARAWVAPRDGAVDIGGHVAIAEVRGLGVDGNGVQVTISRNDEPVWGPQVLAGDDVAGIDAAVADLDVSAGDVIRFEVADNGAFNVTGDVVDWDPNVTYHGDTPVPPLPGTDWRDIAAYHAEEFGGDPAYWKDSSGTVSRHYLQPGDVQPVARVWTAPRSGVVDITGEPAIAKFAIGSNGVRLRIVKNDDVVWGPQKLADNHSSDNAAVEDLAIAAGDTIRFEVASRGTNDGDVVVWDPDLVYEGESPLPVAAEAWSDISTFAKDPVGVYGAFWDGNYWYDDAGFVWAGSLQPGADGPGVARSVARAWVAPKAGTVQISGHAAKTAARRAGSTGDGVTVSILKNDRTVWGPARLAADDITGIDATVADLAVAAGDVIRFRVGNGGRGDNTGDIVDWDPVVIYSGQQPPAPTYPSGTGGGNGYVKQSVHYSRAAGAKAQLSFRGVAMRVIGDCTRDQGWFKVILDGDMTFHEGWCGRPLGKQNVLWEVTGLTPGRHELELEASTMRSYWAEGNYFTFDAIQYLRQPKERLKLNVDRLKPSGDRRGLEAKIELNASATVALELHAGQETITSTQSVSKGGHTVRFTLDRQLQRGRRYDVTFTARRPGYKRARVTTTLMTPR